MDSAKCHDPFLLQFSLCLCLCLFFDGFKNVAVDYVLGDKKFGGNAQSIIKDRFLHHTSFLWDYQDFRMAYLKLPQRAPTYRLVSFFYFFALTSFQSLN